MRLSRQIVRLARAVTCYEKVTHTVCVAGCNERVIETAVRGNRAHTWNVRWANTEICLERDCGEKADAETG